MMRWRGSFLGSAFGTALGTSGPEEFLQRRQCLLGRFLGQKMPARQRRALDVARLFPPDRQRLIEPADHAFLAPQDEEWAGDFAIGVGGIVLEVDRGAGAVILARRVDGRGVAKAAAVLGDRFRREDLGPAAPGAQRAIEKKVGRAADEAFGEVVGLDEKEPVVVISGE